jgi:hypothetical protein
MPNYTETTQSQPKQHKRKYRITEELAKFTKEIQTEKRKEIMQATGITRQTLSLYENLPAGHKTEMKHSVAIAIAKILGFKPENLEAK